MDIAQASTPSEAPRRGVVPLSAPEFGGREWDYLQECLRTGWVSSAGPFVERFERAIAEYVGVAHAVATVNGTSGLHVALRVAGVEPGDEVLVSDLTFIAPVNAIRYCGAIPVLIDVDPRSWQMDAGLVERFLAEQCERRDGAVVNRTTGRRVRAIVPVHVLGLACDMDSLMAAAKINGLRVVEDAAEAMGVRYRGRHVGTFGDLGVFSFNGNKVITSGGGGMIVTGQSDEARLARYLTTQAKDDPQEYIHRQVGYNYRLTSLQAALGVAQLEQLAARLAQRRALAAAYAKMLTSLSGVTPMPISPDTEPSFWLYTVLLDERTSMPRRQQIIAALAEAGFEARSLWHPMHGLPPYRHCQFVGTGVSMDLYRRAISLPSGAGVGIEDVAACVKALSAALARS